MQKLKVKGLEVIKINNKRVAVHVNNDDISVRILNKEDENALCNKYLDLLYACELGINSNLVKQNNEGESYFEIYSQDDTKTSIYYLKNCRIIKDPTLYGIGDATDDRSYILYADENNVKILTKSNTGVFAGIREIRDEVLDGDISLKENK